MAAFQNKGTRRLQRILLTQRYSRQALKKFIGNNWEGLANDKSFDQQFNRALRTGVEKADFTQPKGTCPIAHLCCERYYARSCNITSYRLHLWLVLTFPRLVGTSGPVKLAKKEAAPKKASPPKEAAAKVRSVDACARVLLLTPY